MKNSDEGLEETSNQELEQIQPTAEELAEIKDQGYLEDSAAIVGYATRQEQFNAYGEAVVVIPQGSSILDFGCGRGDFYSWHQITYNNPKFDYLGVDANQVLIDTGNKIYDNINLKCLDWNNELDNQGNFLYSHVILETYGLFNTGWYLDSNIGYGNNNESSLNNHYLWTNEHQKAISGHPIRFKLNQLLFFEILNQIQCIFELFVS